MIVVYVEVDIKDSFMCTMFALYITMGELHWDPEPNSKYTNVSYFL